MVTVLSSVDHAVTEAFDSKKNLAFRTTDLRIKQLTGGLKVQAYILMAFYCQQSVLLMCLTLSCSEGLACGEFIVNCLIFLR